MGGVGVFACLTYKGLLLWDLLLIEMIAGLSPTVRSHTTYYYYYCPIQYSALWQVVNKYLRMLLDSSVRDSGLSLQVLCFCNQNLGP